ncbi:methyltransferase [Alishewanella sp. BS5-314]|uniref:tRNA1(Val) (adenine(37)-N6)-methyltransferase n=1 Tax=Alishewanella sp. BS5-314 TaxID=2755587 RepID=UPI0021BB6A4F|nr:methyltransferase [Alishewanella sp. BS5-314]MCT8124557.1 methyltransferase [Alishewanella sp. BS5-314]
MSAGFQCKQFYIGHQHCAMKVGTDALLLGAWATLPVSLQANPAILDIGSGSGILSLMLAQRTGGHIPITAVELDTHAAAQAAANVAASPWPEAIRVIKGDILTYSTAERYALIISNPPFFQDALPSQDATRQQARHTASLPFAALLEKAASLLAPGGEFSLVLPAASQMAFTKTAVESGWLCQRLCTVKSKADKPVSRYLQSWIRYTKPDLPVITKLLIYQSSNEYSSAYRNLLVDFYLKF